MSIDKNILYEKIVDFIEKKISPFSKGTRGIVLKRQERVPWGSTEERGEGFKKQIIITLIKKIIYNHPTKNCIIKGDKTNWQGLPKSKSLFFAGENIGIPIGNLTSQIFANFYLDFLDKFIKQKLKIKYYGRYVDDFVLIHSDKEYLKICKREIQEFLKHELGLTLHPNKVYLQHYRKGVLFLGSFILPYRIYLKNKTKGTLFQKIHIFNTKIRGND